MQENEKTTVPIPSVGADGEQSLSYVTICAGAGVFGDIQIADDVMIASNAVVVKNIETCGAVVGGVPAKIIGMNSGWNMNQFVKGIEEE